MTLGVAIKMKRAGYKAGFPDMLVLEPRGKYHGLFWELKVNDGHPSPEQKWWRDALIQRGYKAMIVPRGLTFCEAQDYLVLHTERYLAGEE